MARPEMTGEIVRRDLTTEVRGGPYENWDHVVLQDYSILQLGLGTTYTAGRVRFRVTSPGAEIVYPDAGEQTQPSYRYAVEFEHGLQDEPVSGIVEVTSGYAAQKLYDELTRRWGSHGLGPVEETTPTRR